MSRMQAESQTIIDLLKELVRWTKIQGISKAKEILIETLKTSSERVAYVTSDGRGSQEVAKSAGISHTTVVNYWNKWARLGIVEPLRVKGGIRYRAVFTLSELGMGVDEKAGKSGEE